MSSDDPRRGTEWHKARTAAVARDGGECRECGEDVGPRKDPTVKEWAVHHTDEDPSNHDLSNLVTLCRSCHEERHRQDSSSVGRYRAIMTETDRDHIARRGDPTDRQVDQSAYRVRLRINEELARDIEILEEHRPDLLEELREVVCENGGVEQ